MPCFLVFEKMRTSCFHERSYKTTFYDETTMAATLLYHMYGIQNYLDLHQQIVPNRIGFYLAVPRNKLIYPSCGSTRICKKVAPRPAAILFISVPISG